MLMTLSAIMMELSALLEIIGFCSSYELSTMLMKLSATLIIRVDDIMNHVDNIVDHGDCDDNTIDYIADIFKKIDADHYPHGSWQILKTCFIFHIYALEEPL